MADRVDRQYADLEQRLGAFGQPAVVDERSVTTCDSPAIAGPVATGSVASAATSSAGTSPRRSARSKPAGISTANSTAPEASTSSSSSLSRNWRVTLKNLVLRSAARMERPTSLDSCSNTAVGRSRGIVLIA